MAGRMACRTTGLLYSKQPGNCDSSFVNQMICSPCATGVWQEPSCSRTWSISLPKAEPFAHLQMHAAKSLTTTGFHWTAVYDSSVNLDSILLTVKALEPERFEECLRLVNLALEHRQKRITGFGPKGRLVVKGTMASGRSYHHGIEELSSGERQMLLLVGFLVAFLRPGGIVLLDEPDLHIHIAMVDQLLETVERIVQERKGQWIVASHSVRVWEWFAREEERIDLSPWRGVNT